MAIVRLAAFNGVDVNVRSISNDKLIGGAGVEGLNKPAGPRNCVEQAGGDGLTTTNGAGSFSLTPTISDSTDLPAHIR